MTQTLTPDLQTMSNLLCTAFEGGSNYWYCIKELRKPEALTFLSDARRAKVMEREPEVFRHLDYPLNEGGALVIEDREEDGRVVELTLDSCLRGWQIMHDSYPQNWADAMSENDDAETGDVFLQCCLFGEVIYG